MIITFSIQRRLNILLLHGSYPQPCGPELALMGCGLLEHARILAKQLYLTRLPSPLESDLFRSSSLDRPRIRYRL